MLIQFETLPRRRALAGSSQAKTLSPVPLCYEIKAKCVPWVRRRLGDEGDMRDFDALQIRCHFLFRAVAGTSLPPVTQRGLDESPDGVFFLYFVSGKSSGAASRS